MYFKNFPKIYYSFQALSETQKLQIMTDITLNVRVRKNALEKITIYDEYDMMEGETPEIIAEKYYGDPNLHWILMLVNQKYDYINDFPMQQSELFEHTTSVYGAGNENKVHHYTQDGFIVEGRATLLVPSNIFFPQNTSVVKIHDFIMAETAKARVEEIDVLNSRLTVMMDHGKFEADDLAAVVGFRRNEITQLDEFGQIFTFHILENSFTVHDTFSIVTNFDHESTMNEKKRRIKLLAPNLVNQFVTEFEQLMNQ